MQKDMIRYQSCCKTTETNLDNWTVKNLEKFKENNSGKSKDLTNASTEVDALKTVKDESPTEEY